MKSAVQKIIVTSLVLASQVTAVMSQPSEIERSIVGGYRRGSVDTLTELFILEDKTFCLAFMGGSADLSYAGRWKTEGDEIVMDEVKPKIPLFPVRATTDERRSKPRTVRISGRALSASDRSIIFGTSDNGELPRNLQTVIPSGYNGFSRFYTVPTMVKVSDHIFVGVAVRGARNESEGTNLYKISQYKFDDPKLNLITIHFNREALKPPLKFIAKLDENRLQLTGSDQGNFGKKRPISDKVLEAVKTRCINPVLAESAAQDPAEISWPQPVKEQELKLNLSNKKTMFELGYSEREDEPPQKSQNIDPTPSIPVDIVRPKK